MFKSCMSSGLSALVRPSIAARLVACAAAFAAASTVANAQVGIDLTMQPQVVSFSPLASPIYVLFGGINSYGFTDQSNFDNSVVMRSGDSSFTIETYPGRFSGGSSSYGFSSTSELSNAINNAGDWSVTVTDGATGVVSEYIMTVSTAGIPHEFLRPILLDVTPNTPISPTPTFNFSIDPTSNPDAEYTGAGAAMFGADYLNSVFSPSITTSDTSWTPDGPLNDDTYLLQVTSSNDNSPQWLVDVSTPSPVGEAFPLAAFTSNVRLASESQAPGLTVGDQSPFDVQVTFTPAAIGFSSIDPTVYIMSIGITATGFVDESNVDNYIRLESANNYFSGDRYPATGNGSGSAGSIGLISPEFLSEQFNDEPGWRLLITDGTTGITHEYSLSISTTGVPLDIVRPITLDLAEGSPISETPTFDFSIDDAATPEGEFTYAFGFIQGDIPNNYVTTPAITPADRSWSPDSVLIPDTYTMVIGMLNGVVDASLITTSSVTATSPDAPAVNLTHTVDSATYAQRGGLTVAAYCPADFNLDGGVDGADVSEFFGAWESGDSLADVNRDGGVDGGDIDVFFAAWEAGGC